MIPQDVLIALGGNQAEPMTQLARAVAALAEVVRVDRVSSVYRTEPVGFREQPDFLNAVLAGSTTLAPEALLDATQAIEERMGRVHTFRNAPRIIDIDVLGYGERVLDSPRLTLPHPRLASRGFVLHPLAEIAPDWRHPASGETVREMLRKWSGTERVERYGPLEDAR